MKKYSWLKYLPYLSISVVIILAVVFGGSFVKKWFEKMFGPSKEAQKYEELQNNNDAKKKQEFKQQFAKQASTKTDAEWILIADQLKNAFDYAGYLPNYRNDAWYQLKRVQNNTDYYKLEEKFGRRPLKTPFIFWSGGDYSISDAVRERMNQPQIDEINESYRRRGITHQF